MSESCTPATSGIQKWIKIAQQLLANPQYGKESPTLLQDTIRELRVHVKNKDVPTELQQQCDELAQQLERFKQSSPEDFAQAPKTAFVSL